MEKMIYALGFFDGVHLGHQALLSRCHELAQQTDARTAAITFDRHPQSLFAAAPPLLGTQDDRIALLHRYGMEQVHILPVCRQVMATAWTDFLKSLTERGAVGFVCGDDFRFGANGAGNAENLRTFCAQNALACAVVPAQMLDGARISSTRVRTALENGDLQTANRLLGHRHTLTGTVVPGRHLGRTLGTPTANVQLPDDVLYPAFGVYACLARVDGEEKYAVTNVGTRPTVGGEGVTVEPWLLDFHGDLYGKKLTLEFHARLRAEENFPNLDALRAQIHADAQKTRQIFEEN